MLDAVQINLDPTMVLLLNLVIVMNMFAVSLNLRPSDFQLLRHEKKPVALGLLGQFILLPFFTFLFTLLVPMHTSVALGLIMVSCVPGGNLSNVFSFLARGNLPLSVSLTAIGFPIAAIVTPLNFGLYSHLHPDVSQVVRAIQIDYVQFTALIALNTLLPLALGCWVGSTFTRFHNTVAPYIPGFSLVSISAMVVLIAIDNLHIPFAITSQYMGHAAAHHLALIACALLFYKACKVNQANQRTLTIEVAIQNAPLGVVLLLTFMPTLGGAVVTVMFWGAWQILATLLLAVAWRYSTSR